MRGLLMKRAALLIALCLSAFTVTAQSANRDRFCREPKENDTVLPEIWQPAEISGRIEYSVGEKDGKPLIRLPVIEKDGILYKLHVPMPFLKEAGIRSGDYITVTGKARPSAWTKDRSVSFIVLSVKTEETEKEVLWPSRREKIPAGR